MSLSTRLLTASPIIVALAVAIYFLDLNLEESVDKLGGHVIAELLSDKNIFVVSVAYGRWALPCPGVPENLEESKKTRAAAALALGLVAKWNIEHARVARVQALEIATPVGFLLCQFWPLFIAHINSYLSVAIWYPTALASVLGVQLSVLVLYWTTWWYPLASALMNVVNLLLPVNEVISASSLLRGMIGPDFDQNAAELFIVVSYVQVALGYANIWYMRQDKARKNSLLDVASGKLTAKDFLLERAFVYAISVAAPYMLQRSIMETANSAAFQHFFNKVEQSLRVDAFLHATNAGEDAHNRLDVVRDSNYTVDGYAESFNNLIHTGYRLLEGKLYELPNLVLLSGMLLSQPILTLTLLPVSIILDFGRVRVVSFVTTLVEQTTKILRGLADKRKKIEQHDTRHADIISRTGAASIVAGRWENLASEILDATVWRRFLQSTKLYMNWIYYNNLLGVGIECALSRIMEIGRITAADIGVYAMVIEDAIGFLLTRFREEAALAELQTHQQRLSELQDGFQGHAARIEASTPHCFSEAKPGALRFRNFSYAWGSLHVEFPDLDLSFGKVYAITGPNGCGKSTLFSLLAACRHPLPMPTGLVTVGQAVFPSDELVEIPQRPYHPLYIKPLAWLLDLADLDGLNTHEAQERVVQISADLRFKPGAVETGLSSEELQTETSDWYGELSGGQRTKAELLRQIFLKDRCPKVVLMDEAFAPLDPTSKLLVQQKLKEFCKASVILVIYHTGDGTQCVSGNDFFDDTLRFSNGTAKLVGLC